MEKKHAHIQEEMVIKLVKVNGRYKVSEFAGSNAVETNDLIFEIDHSVRMYNRSIKDRETIQHNIEERISNGEYSYNTRCEEKEIELKRLRYYHDTSVGLWCIDQNPKTVSHDWIVKNAFRLKDAGISKKRI